MTTVSAQIDKHLKHKLISEARKEDKSVSDLVREALNEIDFDKDESNGTDDKSKTKRGEEATSSIPKEINNLSTRLREIENALAEIGKAEVSLGELIAQQAADHEKKRLDEIQREDAHRIYLHNKTIDALEKIANKNLEECKGHHPHLSEQPNP